MRLTPTAARSVAVAVLAVAAGALVTFALAGATPVNYDTTYGLAWGQQLAHGQAPQLRVPLAPTPKPLLTVIGVGLGILGPDVADAATALGALLALGALALVAAVLAWRLAGWPAAAIAWLVVLTRVPLLSFGARAYVDVPYCALVLAGVCLEARRPRAGLPALALLSVAGLLRPEAWLLALAYAVYCGRGAPRRQQLGLAALAVSAPLLWLAHDAALTGDPLWSLVGTRATGQALERPTGVLTALGVAPRRVAEIVREPVIAGAAVGLAVAVLRRSREQLVVLAALALTSASFVLLAGAGLPALGRYLMLPAVLSIVIAAAGVVSAAALGRWGRSASVVVAASLLVFAAPQARRVADLHRTLTEQGRVLADARELLRRPAVRSGCWPWRTPNHRLVPLVALELELSPGAVAADLTGTGTSLLPRSRRVTELSLLDPRDRNPTSLAPSGGGHRLAENQSWTAVARCAVP